MTIDLQIQVPIESVGSHHTYDDSRFSFCAQAVCPGSLSSISAAI